MVIPSTPLFVPGAPGGPELLIILFIAILLFGANKIPKLARSTGEAMGEFQMGREKAEQELEALRNGDAFDDGEGGSDFADTNPAAAGNESKVRAGTEQD